ncbi:MAG: hypothetical protein ACXVCX_11990 [Ktedonobacterales bacterium]
MGQERTSRFGRGHSAKRTLITGAMRRAPVPPQAPQGIPQGSDDLGGQAGGDEDLSELRDGDGEYETLVMPMVTLPTLPTVHAVRGIAKGEDDAEAVEDGGYEEYEDEYDSDPSDDALFGRGVEAESRFAARRRATTQARALTRRRVALHRSSAPAVARSAPQHEPRLPVRSNASLTERLKRLRALDVMLVPAGKRVTGGQRTLPAAFGEAADRFAFLRAHRVLLVVLTVVTVLSVTVTTAVSTGQVAAFLAGSSWQTLSGSGTAPTPTPRPAPDIVDAGHYVAKYGFDWPADTRPLPEDERQRIVFMLPAAYKAASAYDQRYHQSIEPELIVWWTHAEGIGARINYSNCANRPTRPGTNYFTNIENCPVANFWQLGYGNQFSVIYVLKNAFTDLYGNPNDTKLVQKVGQWVLDFDQRQGTVPKCGGYSCTFPAKTIDQISAGINQNTGALTEENWWASVLSRDPAINCYMVAHALTFFNHNATRSWVGCYYAEPCWGYESNRLGDILSAWPGLRRAANIE